MTVDNGRANLAAACALVDELARQGIHHAIICPGSRSTPVAVALAAHPDVRIWVHIDERSAAFFALGMARQIGTPVVLLSTSGTAAANFLPAVAEAHLSRIPLIVLTADRPPELRDWGAAQTIDQLHLYGSHAKWFADMPVPTDDETLLPFTRATAARAAQTSRSSPPGPVHLNLPFREPLLPTNLTAQDISLKSRVSASRAPLPLRWERGWGEGRSGRGRWAIEHQAADIKTPPQYDPNLLVTADIASLVQSEPRGIIVCGPGESPNQAAAAITLGKASGYPVLADPLSGVRFGPHDRAHVIDAYDPFLRDPTVSSILHPQVVLRVGALPTSKPLQQFLLAHPGTAHVVIDAGSPRDPSHLATHYVHADETETLCALAKAIGSCTTAVDHGWLETWQTADRVTRAAIEQTLAAQSDLTEGGIAADVADLLPDGATLIAGNSMPIRDVDAFVRGDSRRLRVLGNRGANGIDGMNSTALGAAAVGEGPVTLLVGDLSFLHDLGGLIAARLFDLSATIMVVNNDGGGIFSFLPQADLIDETMFETLFGTPTGLDVAAAARLFGASYAGPRTRCAFRRDVSRALVEPGLSIVEGVTDRTRNVAQHREVWAAVSEALRKADSIGG